MIINARPLARAIATVGFVTAAVVGGLFQPSAVAQDTIYGTSGMDRGQAGQARLQAQQSAMLQNLQNVAACGNSGRLYGPAFGGPRSGNCPSALTLQSSGGIAITGGATISGNSRFNNNLAVNGTLAVGGTSTLGGRLTVNAGGIVVTGNSSFANAVTISGNASVGGTLTSTNRIFADNGVHIRSEWLRINGNNGVLFNNHGGGWHMSDTTWIRAHGGKSIFTSQNVRANGQFQIGTSVFGPPPSCNVNTQKLHWNNGWSCQTLIGSAGAGEVDPSVGTLTNNRWCRAQSGRVECNITAPPSCNANTQKLRWTGSAWECVTDNAWSQISGKPSTFPPASHNHDDRYLRLSGGTLSGNLNMGGRNLSNVGTITANRVNTGDVSGGRWCRANTSGRIQCTASSPSLSCTTRTTTTTVAANATGTASISCQSDETLTGGGCDGEAIVDDNNFLGVLRRSYASSDNTWRCRWARWPPGHTLTAQARCCRL